MAGAELGKADVGEGRMAASEGANGGEYADEGQERRGGNKKFSQTGSISYTILRRFGLELSDRKRENFALKMHILTAFEGHFYLRSLSLRFYPASFAANVYNFVFFSLARRHRAFQQVAENSSQALLRGREAKSSWQVHQNCRG